MSNYDFNVKDGVLFSGKTGIQPATKAEAAMWAEIERLKVLLKKSHQVPPSTINQIRGDK